MAGQWEGMDVSGNGTHSAPSAWEGGTLAVGCLAAWVCT